MAFSSAVTSGQQKWWNWNRKPISRLRNAATWPGACRSRLPVKQDFWARRRNIERAQQVHQGRLAHPGGADHRNQARPASKSRLIPRGLRSSDRHGWNTFTGRALSTRAPPGLHLLRFCGAGFRFAIGTGTVATGVGRCQCAHRTSAPRPDACVTPTAPGTRWPGNTEHGRGRQNDDLARPHHQGELADVVNVGGQRQAVLLDQLAADDPGGERRTASPSRPMYTPSATNTRRMAPSPAPMALRWQNLARLLGAIMMSVEMLEKMPRAR